jgi:hypothetical protein
MLFGEYIPPGDFVDNFYHTIVVFFTNDVVYLKRDVFVLFEAYHIQMIKPLSLIDSDPKLFF